MRKPRDEHSSWQGEGAGAPVQHLYCTRGSCQRAVALHRAQDRAALVKNLFDLRFLYHRQLQLSLCLFSNKKSRGVEAPTEENEA